MRLERLNYNKIKIFLTTDDLSERGLTKEDIWKDSLKWHQLFHDMLEEASVEFGVDIYGSVAVEIFSMQAQGMVMIVTMEDTIEEEDSFEDGFIEMQVTVEGSEDIIFEFQNIEDVIQLSKRLSIMGFKGQSSLFSMKSLYFLLIKELQLEDIGKMVAILAEYGHSSFVTIHRLQEYGKTIAKERAVETLNQFFN